MTSRHAGGDTIEVYKILNIYDKEVCPNLSLNNQATQCHSFKLKKNIAQKDIGQYYFTLRVTDIWNSLPVFEVTAETLLLFIIYYVLIYMAYYVFVKDLNTEVYVTYVRYISLNIIK